MGLGHPRQLSRLACSITTSPWRRRGSQSLGGRKWGRRCVGDLRPPSLGLTSCPRTSAVLDAEGTVVRMKRSHAQLDGAVGSHYGLAPQTRLRPMRLHEWPVLVDWRLHEARPRMGNRITCRGLQGGQCMMGRAGDPASLRTWEVKVGLGTACCAAAGVWSESD